MYKKFKIPFPLLILILLISTIFNLNSENYSNNNHTISTKYHSEILSDAEHRQSLPLSAIDIDSIPPYTGNPHYIINNNIPFFEEKDYTITSFENYSSLDSLGRCQSAYACIGYDIMPTGEREKIGSIKPTGWKTVKYENISGKYLYNRCHLLGFQLTGEGANELNLITATRYMNINGMLPYENLVASYIRETLHHVLMRVTPVFKGDNLLASGVIMEGYSIEDRGAGICFNVFCYNVQPGIFIDYSDGSNKAE